MFVNGAEKKKFYYVHDVCTSAKWLLHFFQKMWS